MLGRVGTARRQIGIRRKKDTKLHSSFLKDYVKTKVPISQKLQALPASIWSA